MEYHNWYLLHRKDIDIDSRQLKDWYMFLFDMDSMNSQEKLFHNENLMNKKTKLTNLIFLFYVLETNYLCIMLDKYIASRDKLLVLHMCHRLDTVKIDMDHRFHN